MDVAVGVPKRENRVTVAVRDARLARALHERILAVDVAQEVGVDQRMVKRRVEDRPLLLGAALDADARKIVVPAPAGCGVQLVERCAGRLFGVEVFPRVLRRDVGDAHADFDLLAGGEVVEREPVAHVIAREFAAVLRIELILAVVGGPLGLYARHGALLLPVTRLRRGF